MKAIHRHLGAGAALCALMAAAAAAPAGASDLESLRVRAQAAADVVSDLEHRLEDLDARRSVLESRVEAVSAELGRIDLARGRAEAAHKAAVETFVQRAIAAYKAGPASELALLLSAQTPSDLYAIDLATSAVARADARALHELTAAREAVERAGAAADARKGGLLRARAEVDAVAAQAEAALDARAAALAELTDEIARLEAQARAAAAAAADPSAALLDLLRPSGPAAGIPDGFAGTGVTFEGIASWYGPGFEGNPTANGDIFDPDLYTAASRDLPLGTWLYVEHAGRGVVVLVNDRGPYIEERILDLSQAAAEAIGITGLGWIEAEILIKA